MPQAVRPQFEHLISVYQKNFGKLQSRDRQLSFLRFALFVLFLSTIVWLANEGLSTAFTVVLFAFPFVFGVLVNYHNRLRHKKERTLNKKEINEEECNRLEHKFSGLYSGQAYLKPQHPYALDLDLFGSNSIFQLLCRATTQQGRDMLAHWLCNPADRKEILNRQQAVNELRTQLEWRQEFQAAGRHHQIKEGENELPLLMDWLHRPAAIAQKSWVRVCTYLLPALAVSAMILIIAASFNYLYILPFLALNGFFLSKIQHAVKDTHEATSRNVKVLRAYTELISMIEKAEFQSPYLQDLQEAFRHEKHIASQEIRRLRFILDNLDNRGNMLYHIINIFLTLDAYWLLQAEKWKTRMEADLHSWFRSISIFETLNSFAGFAFANAEYIMPVISEQTHTLKTQQLGHPLIPAASRVSNDFEINGKGSLAIITGSNMSGKSTFERTVGLNIILALAGAPVCAEHMEVSVTQVFSSMRTTDSLEESVSSFYAELRRLKQLLDLLKNEQPVFFMLDEILKGTNSADRHKGAEGLIRQLSRLNASGMVSTHDLSLSRMAEELHKVVNFSFESQIKNDEILFDYQLKEGPCRSFNASKLMQKMGIEVAE